MNRNLLFFLLFFSSFGFTQNAPWMNFNTTNSLMPSNQVNAIAIDVQGVKWIAAEKGFVKFDNVNWVIYNRSNSSLSCPHPLGVAIDQYGIKWIATFCQGLVKFDGSTFTTYDTMATPVSSIAIDKNDIKWAGMQTGGVAKFDGTNWIFYTSSNSPLPSNVIKYIAVDPQNNKWIATDNGLAKFDDVNWTIYNTSNSGLPDNNVMTITIDNNSNKWIGTYTGGLAKFNTQGWVVYDTLNSGLQCNLVYSIALDQQNTIWVGTCHGGLNKFDGVNWTVYNTSNSNLPQNWNSAIAIEPNGNKWIGLHDNGLAAYNEGGVILPVELTSFISIVKHNDILLQWNTATENNSSIFQIERKSLESPWNKITEIQAAGNSSTPKIYSYTDKNLRPGNYFYRLKMIDIDGKFKYSNEIETNIAAPREYILNQNFPNPFNPTSRISFSLPKTSFTTLKIYNVLGREVQTIVSEILSSGTHNYEFDGRNLNSGVYFYTLMAGNFSSTKKMILMK